MTKDQRNALVIGGVGVGILALLIMTRPSGIGGTVAGVDPSTLGGGTGTTGVAGINPVMPFPVDIGGNAVYPPVNIPPNPPFGYNAPSNVWNFPNALPGTAPPGPVNLNAPDDSDLLRRILAALGGLGGSSGCCAQAPATIYIPSTPMLPPSVPAASIPPLIPSYPPPKTHIVNVQPNNYFGGGNALGSGWGAAAGPSILNAGYRASIT